MPWTPHVCPIQDVPLAVKTITSVLESMPYVRFVYDHQKSPPPPGKAENLSVELYRILTTGLVLTIDAEEKCVGVAVWHRPVRQSFLSRVADWCVNAGFDVWSTISKMIYGDGGFNHKKAAACDKIMKQARQEILGEGNEKDTWYLAMLAVLPEYHGKGVGKALVKYVTDISDRDGMRCYVPTSRPEPNVAIYERLGFTLKRAVEVKEDESKFSFYCMVREALPQ